MPFLYALRDAFGVRDVIEDVKSTLKGRGVSYQAYEPAEGSLHVGEGRMRRIRAGLRYTKGGTQKYWIQQPGEEGRIRAGGDPVTRSRLENRFAEHDARTPLLAKPPPQRGLRHGESRPYDSDSECSDAPSLDFEGAGPGDQWEEAMYSRAKKIEYIGYPNVDVSREKAKKKLRDEEDGVLAGRWMRKAKQVGGKIMATEEGTEAGVENGQSRNNGKKSKKRGLYGTCG